MQNELKRSLDKALVTAHGLDNEHGLFEFETIISDISGFSDPDVIGPLLLLIPDSGYSDEAAFSIIHYVETFDDKTYISSVLKMLDVFYSKSPYWCCVVILRIMNNSASFEELKSQIETSASAVRQVFATVCTDVAQRFPAASGKINAIYS